MENRIWEIIAASIHGEELSQEEISTLQVWLDENKQNRDEYARLQIFYAENKGSLTDNINVQRAWEDNYARRKAGKMIRLRRKIVRWGYAAVVTLVIGVGVLLLTEKDDEQAVKVEFVESQIVPGSPKAVLTLASGEELDLQEEGQFVSNAETELRFPVAFGDSERRIFLKGEAYFDVAKEAERPFVVCVTGVDVTALGTEFNIAAVQGGDEVLTTLVNGSVRVVNEEGAGCILTPAEQAVCKKGVVGIEVQKVNTNLYTSWKDGYYAFDKQPLGEIMRTLERWYDIHVVFADSVAGKLRFSGRLKRYEDIDNLLTMIKLTNDVDFEIAERVIIVRTNKNRK